jgi:hypothetical protein
MLSKCANPVCSASFRYFHEGKLFRIETSGAAESVQSPKPAGRVEFFWLCDRCAPEMILEYDVHGHVRVTPAVRGYREAS